MDALWESKTDEASHIVPHHEKKEKQESTVFPLSFFGCPAPFLTIFLTAHRETVANSHYDFFSSLSRRCLIRSLQSVCFSLYCCDVLGLIRRGTGGMLAPIVGYILTDLTILSILISMIK